MKISYQTDQSRNQWFDEKFAVSVSALKMGSRNERKSLWQAETDVETGVSLLHSKGPFH